MLKIIYVCALTILATTPAFANYQCEGDSQGNFVAVNFIMTSRRATIYTNLRGQSDVLTRAGDWNGLATFELQNRSTDYGFFMRLAVPKNVLDGTRDSGGPFLVSFRYMATADVTSWPANDDVLVIDTKLNCWGY